MNIRDTLIRILRRFGLDAPVRRALMAFGLLAPKPHGHGLLIRELRHADYSNGGRTLIEVGSTREDLPGQGSTAVLAEYCAKRGFHFVTVDMDPILTERARDTVQEWSKDFQAVCCKGEDYLSTYEGSIDFVYLDAFDIDHGEHSSARVARYQDLLNTEISNAESARMHLECAMALAARLSTDGMIVFDDTWLADDEWKGKGMTAVPYLLERGFEVITQEPRAVALKPRRGSVA